MRLPLTLPRLLLIAALAATPTIFVPWHSAHAQDADDAEAEQDAEESAKKAEARKAAKRAAPPSALPGAEAADDDAGHARVDTNPTTALFDAINRGSLNASKEALNRGADMNGHNILDQTPLDMAIDLNRKDIMFLLLSMRTYNPDGRLETSVKDSGVQMKGGSGHLTIGGKASTATRAAPSPHFDEKGGTADPASGFLGFAGR
ncbi:MULTISPECIES: ankyrin repeat domain-containing protein [Gluconobacter]|uniref:Ankyrin n=1 Tax=Gluconobacter cerinus TaxID=38307 RepID=A0AAV5NGT8_9PROT|nr:MULTISPECIES: ankyrin repeat domain-containing protein [Gluconobacter]MBS0994917.1 ankyrin repeat domain-containing protein [Gluconobacter cerinus]MBS1019722.1 ankyrin repeat domain-containing protein [Gluconobacter cerinus]MBS1022796.1 ankyrin repeat domain-containing protein [Gluconobacter cerinus]MBS1024600.1 ankyrin repeat domain-containing protein [Gluconobacter cerinus]MBS1034754.1 ankyrin repeat domain-containing protein [Gluconobacter cerinus]